MRSDMIMSTVVVINFVMALGSTRSDMIMRTVVVINCVMALGSTRGYMIHSTTPTLFSTSPLSG